MDSNLTSIKPNQLGNTVQDWNSENRLDLKIFSNWDNNVYMKGINSWNSGIEWIGRQYIQVPVSLSSLT